MSIRAWSLRRKHALSDLFESCKGVFQMHGASVSELFDRDIEHAERRLKCCPDHWARLNRIGIGHSFENSREQKAKGERFTGKVVDLVFKVHRGSPLNFRAFG